MTQRTRSTRPLVGVLLALLGASWSGQTIADAGADLAGDVGLQKLADVPLDVSRVGNGHLVAGRAAIIDRIEADNGVNYVVDRLLWPRDPRWESGASVTAKRGRVNAAALASGR